MKPRLFEARGWNGMERNETSRVESKRQQCVVVTRMTKPPLAWSRLPANAMSFDGDGGGAAAAAAVALDDGTLEDPT